MAAGGVPPAPPRAPRDFMAELLRLLPGNLGDSESLQMDAVEHFLERKVEVLRSDLKAQIAAERRLDKETNAQQIMLEMSRHKLDGVRRRLKECRAAQQRGWADLPANALLIIATRLREWEDASAVWARPALRRALRPAHRAHRAQGAAGGEPEGAAPPRQHGLLAFALTCKGWRRVQRACGPLRTRISSLVGRAEHGGSGKLVRWAVRTCGCPQQNRRDAPDGRITLLSLAARGGNPEVLAALIPVVYEPGSRQQLGLACAEAAWGGHADVLQSLLQAPRARAGPSTAAAAAAGGHLGVLRWLREQGYPWDEQVVANAAAGGHLHVIAWAREHGCPWDETACVSAVACERRLEVVRWLRGQGAPMDELTAAEAAEGGHAELLELLHELDCPWDGRTCAAAARGGHLALLQWARGKGCQVSAGRRAGRGGRGGGGLRRRRTDVK